MRLWVFSDLHLEFGKKRRQRLQALPDADVCVVAGDVLTNCAQSIHFLSREVAPHMPVVCVAGNHEFYDDSIVEGVEWARTTAAEVDRVHFLENDSVVIDGVRFFGCTLWTDYALHGSSTADVAWAMRTAEHQLNDNRLAHWRRMPVFEPFTALHALDLHRRSRGYLDGELAFPHDGPTVVVTHHAPHPRSVHPRYADDPLTPAFASDLSGIIEERQPDLWIHGHMHHSSDYRVGRTRVLCNPRGYCGENRDFDPSLIVEV